jgi:hypothetical protein
LPNDQMRDNGSAASRLQAEPRFAVMPPPSGTRVAYRNIIAKEVRIGGMRFNDVSFAVYAATPWAPDAELGVIGMPILIHAGSISRAADKRGGGAEAAIARAWLQRELTGEAGRDA